MALTVYTSKDNAWREYVNPLRGMTLERIVNRRNRRRWLLRRRRGGFILLSEESIPDAHGVVPFPSSEMRA